MKKYGLQLRVPPAQAKKPTKPPLPPPPGFRDDSDDDDVEREIARQATKKKALKEVEGLHKKALEEDPSVFDYDGVYDEMKETIVRPLAQDRQKRESKYIAKLMEKAKKREQEHEIIYERKLAKERSKDDEFYADKEKFVTSVYKQKLAEQAKWLEEERLRELREEKEDVTKKADMSDFYFNLTKNVAFGGKPVERRKPVTEEAKGIDTPQPHKEDFPAAMPSYQGVEKRSDRPESFAHSQNNAESSAAKSAPDPSLEKIENGQTPADRTTQTHHHKRSEDALAAAKERYLARKRAKEHGSPSSRRPRCSTVVGATPSHSTCRATAESFITRNLSRVYC